MGLGVALLEPPSAWWAEVELRPRAAMYKEQKAEHRSDGPVCGRRRTTVVSGVCRDRTMGTYRALSPACWGVL